MGDSVISKVFDSVVLLRKGKDWQAGEGSVPRVCQVWDPAPCGLSESLELGTSSASFKTHSRRRGCGAAGSAGTWSLLWAECLHPSKIHML